MQPKRNREDALAFLVPGPARDAMFALHPLIENSLHLPWRGVKEIFAALREAITFRLMGVSFEAPSRHGKTFLIETCMDLIILLCPRVAVLLFSAKEHDKGSAVERTHLADLLLDQHHAAANEHRASTLRAALLAMMETEMRASGQRSRPGDLR